MLPFIFRIIALILLIHTSFASTRFLTISDIHYGHQNTSGEGHDTGENLLQLAMNKFSQLAEDVDFIINLGDMPKHGYYLRAKKEIYEKVVFQTLYEANRSAKPMFYVTGNNDSLLGNYQPFSDNSHSPLSLATEWSGACAFCENLLINKEHMYDSGYYSSYVIPNNREIMLIALNSVQFTDLSSRLLKYPNQEKDAFAQLAWFENQLSQHRAKQLLIAMHIPPGKDYQGNPYWEEAYLNRFVELLVRYQANYQQITLLTSHSHMEEIRRINLDQTQTIYAFSTPSISRIHYNNPAMKIFKLDENGLLSNFTTYFTSSVEQWQNERYTAIHHEGIFPECAGQHLAMCLNFLNQDIICTNIERENYYSVKTDRVDNSACRKIYQVN